MIIQVYHNAVQSASLTDWMEIVPNETMSWPLLLGRDSRMRFHFRSYQTLPVELDGRFLGQLNLSHACDDTPGGATAYISYYVAPDVAYHLVYDGEGVSLNDTSEPIPMNLVRLDRSSGFTGHYMADTLPTWISRNVSFFRVGNRSSYCWDTKSWNLAMSEQLHCPSVAFPLSS